MGQLFSALADLGRVESIRSAEAALHHTVGQGSGVAVVGMSPADLPLSLSLVQSLAGNGWTVLALGSRSGLSKAAIAHGASAFVDQGVDPDEIVRTVRELVESMAQNEREMECRRSF